jgi:hypothetical protein
MHDPNIVAFNIDLPFPGQLAAWQKEDNAKARERGLRPPHRSALHIATIWHHDPEKDGSDDSCGWYMRPRHGSDPVLKRIVDAFAFDWDSTWNKGDGTLGFSGWFTPDGDARMSTIGIVNCMFHKAAWEYFGYDRRISDRFMQKHLFRIVAFAENPTDSMNNSIHQVYGKEERTARIHSAAGVVYGCILNWTRPWYKHPRYHVHHWRIQVPFFQRVHGWLFDRCSKCGKGFKYGEQGVGMGWYSKRRMHEQCSGVGRPMAVNKQEAAPTP